jgi:hypothetical protein
VTVHRVEFTMLIIKTTVLPNLRNVNWILLPANKNLAGGYIYSVQAIIARWSTVTHFGGNNDRPLTLNTHHTRETAIPPPN